MKDEKVVSMRSTKPDFMVHPAAELFPMMSDEELAELAEDIKENGLIHPIVLDEDGDFLIDGRNRLKACELAGVEPRFETFSGDAKAFILSANIKRRHMTKGQQAMAHAMLYSEPEKGGRGKNRKETLQFSAMRLSQARTVLAHAADLAAAVLTSTMSLDAAYEMVQHREGEARGHVARLRELRKERPDLAELVDTGKLTLHDACAQARDEAETRKKQRAVFTMNIVEAVAVLECDAARASEFLTSYDPAVVSTMAHKPITLERLETAAAYLVAIIDLLKENNP